MRSDVLPQVIVTNKYLTLMNAMKIVFSESKCKILVDQENT